MTKETGGKTGGKKSIMIMIFRVATNIVVTQPPQRRMPKDSGVIPILFGMSLSWTKKLVSTTTPPQTCKKSGALESSSQIFFSECHQHCKTGICFHWYVGDATSVSKWQCVSANIRPCLISTFLVAKKRMMFIISSKCCPEDDNCS